MNDTFNLIMTGIGTLLVISPAAAKLNESQAPEPSIGDHFASVGQYLTSAILKEVPPAIVAVQQDQDPEQMTLPFSN